MKPFLNMVSGKSKSDIMTFDGGLNVCSDSAFLRDNQLQYMKNVCLTDSPTLKTRSERTTISYYMDDTTSFAMGKVLAMFPCTSKKFYTIEDRRTQEQPNADSYVYKIAVDNGRLVKTYVGTVEYNDNYHITECRDSLYRYIVISAGLVQRYWLIDNPIMESTVINEAEDFISGVLACHKSRLWVGHGKSLKFSQLQDYDNFTIDPQDPINTAGEINITNAQGNIVALVPYDDKLIIFCERSMHVLYGSSPNSEINQFSLVDMENGIGCVSNKTVTIVGKKLAWIDTDFSIYLYNGSSITKISEPYGGDNFASYGGVKDLPKSYIKIKECVMSSYDNYIYIAYPSDNLVDTKNNSVMVYDVSGRVWWVEDGEFNNIIKWETDINTPFNYRTDYLLGSMYNGDIVIMNEYQETGHDTLFNPETRHIDEKEIRYGFETKTYVLGAVKHRKTLTDLWLDASAEAEVTVTDEWSEHYPWSDTYENLKQHYLKIGNIKRAKWYSTTNQTQYYHEGTERQRFIIPRMYMQKINAFSIRVEGTGKGTFYLLEKEWRVK